MKRRKCMAIGICMAAALAVTGCGNNNSQEAAADKEKDKTVSEAQVGEEPVTILMAAAASLEYSMKDDLIPMFQEQYPWITVEGTYDSSGKLQTQIESGMDADLFFSAAEKQMTALVDESLIDADSVTKLLENKIVLIVPEAQKDKYARFEDIVNGNTIAVGDPDSVPAGQYAKEALTSLGLWEQVSEKASLGTNVTEVLNWVSEGSADAGIVYATDAATKKGSLAVAAEAPEGSLADKVIYPAGIVTGSRKKEAAQLFLDFLASEDAAAVFTEYGFTPITE